MRTVRARSRRDGSAGCAPRAISSNQTIVTQLAPCLRSSEWTNLFEFIQAKQLRIENFKEAQRGPGAAAITSYAELEGGDVDAGAQYLAASLCLLGCT